MKCILCGGETERKNVPYTIDRKGYHLYIHEIPALVCSQCGERYFKEGEVEKIQSLIQIIEKNIEELKVA